MKVTSFIKQLAFSGFILGSFAQVQAMDEMPFAGDDSYAGSRLSGKPRGGMQNGAYGLQTSIQAHSTGNQRDQKSSMHVEMQVKNVLKVQKSIDDAERAVADLQNKITETNITKTAAEQQMIDVMKSFVSYFSQKQNLGHVEKLLEFVPQAKRKEFSDKIYQMMPLLQKYDSDLSAFEKRNRGLDKVQDRLTVVRDGTQLPVLKQQKDSLLEDYKRLNDENNRLLETRRERAAESRQQSEQLESLRQKESQLKREIEDLSIQTDENERRIKQDALNRKAKGMTGIDVMTPQEKNSLMKEIKDNQRLIPEKQQELQNVQREQKNVEEQIKRSGGEKIVFVGDQLSKKLDEINRVQSQINKLEKQVKSLEAEEKKLREGLDDEARRLDVMREEIEEDFEAIVHMLRGLPVSKGDSDLARAKEIIDSSKQQFPPSQSTLSASSSLGFSDDNESMMSSLFDEDRSLSGSSSNMSDVDNMSMSSAGSNNSFSSSMSDRDGMSPTSSSGSVKARAFLADMDNYERMARSRGQMFKPNQQHYQQAQNLLRTEKNPQIIERLRAFLVTDPINQ